MVVLERLRLHSPAVGTAVVPRLRRLPIRLRLRSLILRRRRCLIPLPMCRLLAARLVVRLGTLFPVGGRVRGMVEMLHREMK